MGNQKKETLNPKAGNLNAPPPQRKLVNSLNRRNRNRGLPHVGIGIHRTSLLLFFVFVATETTTTTAAQLRTVAAEGAPTNDDDDGVVRGRQLWYANTRAGRCRCCRLSNRCGMR
eukprot:GHVU01116997.1.p2 GENE.GHVU01116997.1~~GHVU01116997.1.p2  ORF type:complete len:115 (-),score=17.19 GHVU01116997.1:172-516(-)